jgi:hypothetical protein
MLICFFISMLVDKGRERGSYKMEVVWGKTKGVAPTSFCSVVGVFVLSCDH